MADHFMPTMIIHRTDPLLAEKKDDPEYARCIDMQMATFLNCLIKDMRGKKGRGTTPTGEAIKQ